MPQSATIGNPSPMALWGLAELSSHLLWTTAQCLDIDDVTKHEGLTCKWKGFPLRLDCFFNWCTWLMVSLTFVLPQLLWDIIPKLFKLGQAASPSPGALSMTHEAINMTSSENSRAARLLSPKWTLSRQWLQIDILFIINEKGDKVHPFRSPNFSQESEYTYSFSSC